MVRNRWCRSPWPSLLLLILFVLAGCSRSTSQKIISDLPPVEAPTGNTPGDYTGPYGTVIVEVEPYDQSPDLQWMVMLANQQRQSTRTKAGRGPGAITFDQLIPGSYELKLLGLSPSTLEEVREQVLVPAGDPVTLRYRPRTCWEINLSVNTVSPYPMGAVLTPGGAVYTDDPQEADLLIYSVPTEEWGRYRGRLGSQRPDTISDVIRDTVGSLKVGPDWDVMSTIRANQSAAYHAYIETDYSWDAKYHLVKTRDGGLARLYISYFRVTENHPADILAQVVLKGCYNYTMPPEDFAW